MRTPKKKSVLIIVISAILLLGIIGGSLAAFISSGYYKGVALLSDYYLSSNILTNLNSEGELNGKRYHAVANDGITNVEVKVRNYDSKMIPDTFDIVYKVKIWLSEAASDGYTYTYIDGDHPDGVEITTTPTEYTGLEILGDGALNESGFTVRLSRPNGADIANAKKVNVVVTPTLPTYMTIGYTLGAQLNFSDSLAQFNVTGSFAPIVSTTDLSDYAGFLYNIATDGTLEAGSTCTATLRWNADMIDIDVATNPLLQGLTINTLSDNGVTKKQVSFGIGTGESYKIAFYRKPGSDWTEITGAELLSFVEFSTITS